MPGDLSADEQTGFEAFPSGRYMDAMRGTKSYPSDVRCPFRQPNRAAAWATGYEAAKDAILDAADAGSSDPFTVVGSL